MKYFVTILMLLVPGASFAQSCNDWSSYGFWQVATPELVLNCVQGRDVNAAPDQGKTAMHYAAIESSNPAVLQALVDSGANVEARDDFGATPIHYAAQNSETGMLEVLINAGADIEAEQDGGARALHLAALHNSPVAVTMLLNARADVHAEDDQGKTAFDYAKRGQTDEALNNYLILKNAM